MIAVVGAWLIACSNGNAPCQGPAPKSYDVTYTLCADAATGGCYASCADACIAQKPPDPAPTGGPVVTGTAKCLGEDIDGGTRVAQCQVIYCGAQ